MSGFDSLRHETFWEVLGQERSPLSLVSTVEELLGTKCSDSGLENREYSRRDPSRRTRGNLYPQELALTSPTVGGHSIGTVSSRTKATEFRFTRTIASGPCQGSHSGRGPAEFKPHSTVSFETPPTWWARSLYLYHPGTGCPVIPPGTEFP
jgi:hypothetical protein